MRKFWAALIGAALIAGACVPASAQVLDSVHGATPAPIARKAPAAATGKHLAMFCGLGAGRSCSLAEIAPAAKRLGYSVSMHGHWESPTEIARAGGWRVLALYGHSAGADRVLREGRTAKARVVVAVDPTVINTGAPRGVRTVVFYNPFNRVFSDGLPLGLLTFGMCCGGKPAIGAENILIRVGHVAMPRDARVQKKTLDLLRGLR